MKRFRFLCTSFSFFVFANQSFGQVTIFNVPSADVVQKNKTFLEHESQFRVNEPNSFINATNYLSRGVGYNTEIDVTQFNLDSPSTKNASVGIGFKSVVPLRVGVDKYQPKIVFGSMMPFSLQGKGVGHWVYSSGVFTIPQSRTRISLGLSFGSKQIFGKNANSVTFGLEQRVSSKLNFINDWYSGDNLAGFFTTGFSYNFQNDIVVIFGYQIPNSKNVGRNSLVFEINKTL